MAEPVKPIVVLDMNLYVSYLITPSGPTARFVELGLAGEAFTIATSSGLMEELRRVVKHPHIISKYTIDPKAVVALLTLLQRRGCVTTGTYAVSKLDEPGDNMVLACALESGASFIVTGDPHLLNLKEFHKVRILSVKNAALALGGIQVPEVKSPVSDCSALRTPASLLSGVDSAAARLCAPRR